MRVFFVLCVFLFNSAYTKPYTLGVHETYLEVSQDCTGYYTKFIDHHRCPNGLMFNQKIQACDLPQNVNCNEDSIAAPNDGIDTTTSTTLSTTIILPKNIPININDPECVGVELAYFPHPFDCAKFVECFNGKKLYLDCPENYHFDKELKICQAPQLSNCALDFRCSMSVDFLPHPTSCEKYIECYFNISYILTRPDRTWFDPERQICSREESKCLTTEPPWIVPDSHCTRYDPVAQASNYGCRLYVQCYGNGNGTLKSCPDGLAFDPTRGLCSADSLKNCRDGGYTVAAWTTQPTKTPAYPKLSYKFPACTEELFVPHPDDEHKFLECVELTAFERQCPDGSRFQPNLKYCSL